MGMTTIGLQPTTVMQAGPWVASALNLVWPKDRSDVLDYINKIRNLWYNSYAQYKLFDNVVHCICPGSFPLECGRGCGAEATCYQAITLPPDVASVEAAWASGEPLKIRSRWREAQVGIDTQALPRVEITRMAETFVTERDMKRFSLLQVYTEREEDNDKKMLVEIVTDDRKTLTLEFKLNGDGWVKSTKWARKILRVILPPDLKGSVTLAQDNGYELSIYEPSDKVPHYTRYRIASTCCPASVLIQGTKKFVDVYFDHDLVEIGDRLIIEAGARYFKFGERSNDPRDLSRAQTDISTMGQLIEGLASRHRGNAVQDQNPFRGSGNTRKSGLPGYSWR